MKRRVLRACHALSRWWVCEAELPLSMIGLIAVAVGLVTVVTRLVAQTQQTAVDQPIFAPVHLSNIVAALGVFLAGLAKGYQWFSDARRSRTVVDITEAPHVVGVDTAAARLEGAEAAVQRERIDRLLSLTEQSFTDLAARSTTLLTLHEHIAAEIKELTHAMAKQQITIDETSLSVAALLRAQQPKGKR